MKRDNSRSGFTSTPESVIEPVRWSIMVSVKWNAVDWPEGVLVIFDDNLRQTTRAMLWICQRATERRRSVTDYLVGGDATPVAILRMSSNLQPLEKVFRTSARPPQCAGRCVERCLPRNTAIDDRPPFQRDITEAVYARIVARTLEAASKLRRCSLRCILPMPDSLAGRIAGVDRPTGRCRRPTAPAPPRSAAIARAIC